MPSDNTNEKMFELLCKKIEASNHDVMRAIKQMDNKLDSVAAKLDALEVQYTDLDNRVCALEQTTQSTQHDVTDIRNELDIAVNTIREENDRNRRKNNIIVMGIQESNNSDSTITDLLRLIAPNHTDASHERVGKPDSSKNRPVRIMLPNSIIKRDALKNCFKLHNNDTFKGISVRPDLTKKQQLERSTPVQTRSITNTRKQRTEAHDHNDSTTKNDAMEST